MYIPNPLVDQSVRMQIPVYLLLRMGDFSVFCVLCSVGIRGIDQFSGPEEKVTSRNGREREDWSLKGRHWLSWTLGIHY